MDINILGLWAHTSTACSASAMDESWTRMTQWYPETWRQLTTEAYCMIIANLHDLRSSTNSERCILSDTLAYTVAITLYSWDVYISW